MKGIIPTGGRGTRMRPITFSANKHLIPVGNKPLIFYPIETVVATGVREIGITYNPGQLPPVKNLLGTGSKWSAKFSYILQPEPKGLANIVQVCESYLEGDSFLFHLGDNIITAGLVDFVKYFSRHRLNGLVSVTVTRHGENLRLGVPYFDKKKRLIKLVEKPKKPPNDLGMIGAYIADHHFFEMFAGPDRLKPSARGEYEIPDAFGWLIDHGYKVEAMTIGGKWLDPGKFDDWVETNRYLLDVNTTTALDSPVDDSVVIEGRVKIAKNCRIRNSHLRGPVDVGDGVEIVDSFIGPFTSISAHSRVIGCSVENSILMQGVSLKELDQPIDTSIIGPDAVICKGEGSHKKLRFFVGESSQVEI